MLEKGIAMMKESFLKTALPMVVGAFVVGIILALMKKE